jgi:hypothetical protein
MSKYFSQAMSPNGLIGAPEPYYIAPPQTTEKRVRRESALGRFFSRAFGPGGLLGAPEAYIPVTPSSQRRPDKFEEAHAVSYSDEYLG